MNDHDTLPRPPSDAFSEGGLRAPAHLGTLGKAWWWFHFLILVKLARLRFIAILAAIGLTIGYWDTLHAYYEKWARPTDDDAHVADADSEFFCPMHPQIVRATDKEPCPLCFMRLSKRKKLKEEPLPPGIVSRVQLSPYRVVLAGIQTTEVGYEQLTKELHTVGFVEFDERKQMHVASRIKGRIDKLFVDVTGQFLNPGDKLASLYSPDLVTTVQNLLDAQKSNNPELLRSARERLRLWGIDDEQIDEIVRTRERNTHLIIRAPQNASSGHLHVIRKYQVEGKYVDEGAPLYDLADLSTVWIQAQVYEDELAFLRENQTVAATTPAYPNVEFRGKVAFIHPHLDRSSRTLTARFDIDNPDHKLRPGMYATVTLQAPTAQLDVFQRTLRDDWSAGLVVESLVHGWQSPFRDDAAGVAPLMRAAVQQALLQRGLVLAVPESAVIDTGSHKIVYRQESPGIYEGVEVTLGPRSSGYYPVLHGLAAGEVIVTTGSFLIDAETRLNPAAGSIYFGGSGGKNERAAATARPSTTADHDADIKAARAKLSPEDRRLVEAQEFCANEDQNHLGSMGVPYKLKIRGQTVFLCCKSCEKEALAHPDETLSKVEKLKRKAKGNR